MKKLILPAFILMVLVQLYVPVKMIFNKEDVLADGREFRFKTAPIDPNDPFRGKYVMLNFDATSFTIANAEQWMQGDDIYVYLTTDSAGFAQIDHVTKDPPAKGTDYVKASLGYIIPDTMSSLSIQYPFDRFYMEETKADAAAQAYNEAAGDTTQVAYALVVVKNGDAVVKDVMINDVPIKDWVKKLAIKPE